MPSAVAAAVVPVAPADDDDGQFCLELRTMLI